MPPSPPHPTQDELDLTQLWRELTWSKAILLSCILGGLILSLLLGAVSTPQYRADVTLAPVESDAVNGALSATTQRLGALASFAGIALPSISDERDIALATLRSRSFTLDFIETRNLMPTLFADYWNESIETWKDTAEPPTVFHAWELFDKKVRKIQESDKGLITVSIVWKDPILAAEWANALVEQLNERLRAIAIQESQDSIKYLNDELLKTSALGPQQLIHSMMESQVNKIMLANVRKEYAFKVIDPALPPDYDSYIWPSYPVLALVGLIAGTFLGGMISMALARRAASRGRKSLDS